MGQTTSGGAFAACTSANASFMHCFCGPSARRKESLMIIFDDQLTTYESVCVFSRSRWTTCKYCGLCVALTLAAVVPWYVATLAVELLLLVGLPGLNTARGRSTNLPHLCSIRSNCKSGPVPTLNLAMWCFKPLCHVRTLVILDQSVLRLYLYAAYINFLRSWLHCIFRTHFWLLTA